MRKRGLIILGFLLFLLSAQAQQKYSFVFNSTLEQAFTLIEEKTNLSIVYNPREVPGNGHVTLSTTNLTAVETVKALLGKDYRITQKNDILTIRYAPCTETPVVDETVPSTPTSTETQKINYEPAPEALPVDIGSFTVVSVSPTVQPVLLASKSPKPVVVSESEKPVIEPETPIVTGSNDTIVEVKKDSVITDSVISSPHRLGISIATGRGAINKEGTRTFVLDARYTYFFHRNWGISLGAGVEDYAKASRDKEDCLMTAYFPVALQMEYPLTKIVSLIGSAGASIELPISGSYCKNADGQRYEQSFYCGVEGSLGTAFRLGNHIGLGTSVYAQSIVATYGQAATQLTGQHIYPWQIGIRLTLQVNSWHKADKH